MSGAEMRVIVGHITVMAMLRRGLLSVLRQVYIFIEKCEEQPQRLWPSVAHEMRLARGLLPLVCANLRSPWDKQPLMTDACVSGYAVCEGDMSAGEVKQVGQFDERWRFKRVAAASIAPRARAQAAADVFDDVTTVRPLVDGEILGEAEMDESSPDVDGEMLRESRWKTLWAGRFVHEEAIHLKEGRGLLAAVRHRSRDSNRHGRRILIMTDNMSAILAFSKGRASSYPLLRLCQHLAAESFASGCRFAFRWVASELNIADGPSRTWEALRRSIEKRALRERWEDSGEVPGGDQRRAYHEHEQGKERSGRHESERSAAHSRRSGGTAGSLGGEGGAWEVAAPVKRELPEGEKERSVTFAAEKPAQPAARRSNKGEEPEGPNPVCASRPKGKDEDEEERKGEEAREEASSLGWGSGNPGGGFYPGEHRKELLQAAQEVLRLRREVRSRDQQRRGDGPGLNILVRHAVSRRPLARPRGPLEGSSRVQAAELCQRRGPQAAKIPARLKRLEEKSAQPDKVASPGGAGLWPVWLDVSKRLCGGGSVQCRYSQLLPQAVGGPRADDYGYHNAGEDRRYEPACASASPFRERRVHQDGTVRPDSGAGRCPSSGPGKPAFRASGEETRTDGDHGGARSRECVSVELQPRRVPQGLERRRGCASPRPRYAVTVPEQARWAQPGSLAEAAKPGRRPAPRKMDDHIKFENLREARESAASAQPGEPGLDQDRRDLPPELRPLHFRWTETPAQAGKRPHLSLFGGVGHCALAFAETGEEAAVVDLSDS
ncbi:unnamed protein product [Polarella glacialis]|uniref:Uncharacterized protein n=1 Tax=Polarella glacialis TaxID=89957 RepID=A0A813DZ95_POLGL|nr:unnamed protein product [Polarella glacialis]